MKAGGTSGGATARRGYLPADVLLLVFLSITAFLLVVSPLSFPGKVGYATLHVALLVAVALVRFVPRDGPPVVRFLRHFFPLLSLPFLYRSMQYLNRLTTTGYFDNWIASLEQAVFASQPSQGFHLALPWMPLSEFLHLLYVVYLLLVPAIALPLFFSRRNADLALFTTSLMATFLFCYTIFTFFPVRGPYYYFGPIDPAAKGVLFPRLVHWILDGASSAGTAFPSSHVAAATCIWLVGRRLYPRIGWALLVVAGGILFATVYGGFHYALDALVGLPVGVAGGLGGPRLHAWILQRQGLGVRASAPAASAEEERAAAAS